MTESAFKAWLSGAKATERSVEIVQDGSLSAKWDDWLRRFTRAQEQDQAAGGERAAGEVSPLSELTAEGEALLALIEGSRTVWYLRGLQADVLKAIEAAHPEPARTWERFAVPRPVAPDNPTEMQAEAFLEAVRLWEDQRVQHNEDNQPAMQEYLATGREVMTARTYEQVKRAFVRAEQSGAVLFESLTVEEARDLHKAIGDTQFGKILATIGTATESDGELPSEADFLSKVSTAIPHSFED